MSVACTSCGHPIPAGQFRCGKCMAVQARELDDEGSLGMLAAPSLRPAAAAPAELASVEQPAEGAPKASGPDGNGAARQDVAAAVEPGPAPLPEESAPRDSLVPKGTFASEVPPEVTPPTGVAPAEPVRARAETPEAPPAREAVAPAEAETPKQQSSSQRMRVARAAQRPPFLASEILREDLAPREPGMRVASAVTSVACPLGLLASFSAGIESFAIVVLAVGFVALFALGRLKVVYYLRAAAMSGVAALSLAAVSWYRLAHGAPPTELLLTAGTTLLPAALFFRAWYRASMLARALVGATLVPALLWALFTSHRELLSLEFVWQSWLPALTWYVFVILCLLALLSFMGDETTGGCSAWALGLCTWHALYACVRAALEVDMPPAARALGLAQPALAAILAVGLAQLLAIGFGQRGRKEAEPLATAPG